MESVWDDTSKGTIKKTLFGTEKKSNRDMLKAKINRELMSVSESDTADESEDEIEMNYGISSPLHIGMDLSTKQDRELFKDKSKVLASTEKHDLKQARAKHFLKILQRVSDACFRGEHD